VAGQRLSSPSHIDRPAPLRVGLVLAAAVMAISSAAPLVRIVEAQAASVAFARVAISAALLGLLLLLTPRQPLGRYKTSALAGVLLALHFFTWFESLRFTSVAVSTLLVTLSPLWVAIVSVLLPRERTPGPRAWLGIVVALGGAALLVLADADAGAFSFRGAGLATIGGMLAAAYFLVSRTARQSTGLLPYAFVANATAAVVLTPFMLADRTEWSALPAGAWWALLALAALPQLVGHNGLSWALRWIPATTVSLIVLLEPLGASMLAALFLGEIPGTTDLVAGAIILLGLALVLRDSSLPTEPATT
jgi:drug/metabolite transporter (DMT)-like permease